ncbi:FAD-binding oxidoreductase [Chelatococcus sp. SYSU_G07232]|uniref:FAD-binding oxidoreductase n=1 Tax=Chelatococcus albus TaxID=3047466 RepID=A0ABT7AJH5_9HYPH|nr:FAD-binding oxidoreductase [Chelatococcus sp. SYSU_G07232]MDJ1159524.1 FAD-binding oxidoreductase [Chelatococcus sp. SYSU_G07232]
MSQAPAVPSPSTADIVIVGGAAMGSSVAYHLLSDPAFTGRVVVVEKDATYARSASALSAASIRQQYSSAINIRISLFGIAFLRSIGERLAVGGDQPRIDLNEGGYLYLAASQEGAKTLTRNHALQTAEGADILLLDRDGLKGQFPWLASDDLLVGTWGRSGEGWFDGWGLLQAFRKKARALGADYVTGEVADLEREGDRITAVRLRDGTRIACGAVVNCAGSDGRRIAASAGLDIPVFPKKRYVFSFTCKGPVMNCPLMIDTKGVYVRPEGHPGADGQMFICGASPGPENDPDWGDDAEDVDWSFFEETIWPALAARVPAFEAIRPGRAWAGPYDMNLLDHNAIVGRAGPQNFYLANGFSGHGLQQSPAVGRGIAEEIVHGRFVTLDLSALGYERILAGRPLREENVI